MATARGGWGRVAFTLLLLACDQTPHCPKASCPTATLTTRLLSGQITYTIGDDAPQTRTLTYLEHVSAPPDQCVARNLVSQVFPSERVNGIGPTVDCSAGSARIGVIINGLLDIRTLTAGRQILPPSVAKLLAEVSQGLGSTPCRVDISSGTVTVDVETATGGAAPYPMLVTEDYARRFAIQVEAIVGDQVFGSGCVPATIVVDMSLEQTAADAVYDPNTPCRCE